MKKLLPWIVLLSSFSLLFNSARAETSLSTPTPSGKIPSVVIGHLGEKISFGNSCDGQTDYPHESRHVPLTVNVEALTECPNQEVFITTTISRHGWWIFPETRSVSGQGYQKVDVNVALPCKWKKGQPPILYVVKSFHRDSEGAKALTGRSQEVRR